MKKPCAQKLKVLKTWLFDVNTATYDVITYQSQGSYDNKFSYKKTLINLKTRSLSFSPFGSTQEFNSVTNVLLSILIQYKSVWTKKL